MNILDIFIDWKSIERIWSDGSVGGGGQEMMQASLVTAHNGTGIFILWENPPHLFYLPSTLLIFSLPLHGFFLFQNNLK